MQKKNIINKSISNISYSVEKILFWPVLSSANNRIQQLFLSHFFITFVFTVAIYFKSFKIKYIIGIIFHFLKRKKQFSLCDLIIHAWKV